MFSACLNAGRKSKIENQPNLSSQINTKIQNTEELIGNWFFCPNDAAVKPEQKGHCRRDTV